MLLPASSSVAGPAAASVHAAVVAPTASTTKPLPWTCQPSMRLHPPASRIQLSPGVPDFSAIMHAHCAGSLPGTYRPSIAAVQTTSLILSSAFLVNSQKICAVVSNVLPTSWRLLVDCWLAILVRAKQMETSFDQEKPKRSDGIASPPTVANGHTRQRSTVQAIPLPAV